MQPIYFTLEPNLPLMIIPDTQAHLDGHTIITQTYHLYRQLEKAFANQMHQRENHLGLNKDKDPNYMGYLTFEVAGRVYSYTADGYEDLSSDEVEQIIEYLNVFRDNPPMWPQQNF